MTAEAFLRTVGNADRGCNRRTPSTMTKESQNDMVGKRQGMQEAFAVERQTRVVEATNTQKRERGGTNDPPLTRVLLTVKLVQVWRLTKASSPRALVDPE